MKRIRLMLLLLTFLGVSAYAEPSGWVTSEERSFTCGESVQIEAEANQGFRFDRWDDGITDNPRWIEVHDSTTYVALFVTASPSTDIGNLNVGPKAQKVLINDKVYIIRGEHMYDTLGKQVK